MIVDILRMKDVVALNYADHLLMMFALRSGQTVEMNKKGGEPVSTLP